MLIPCFYLQDLVPCVLLSFEFEHILVWRGRDWKSSIQPNASLDGSQVDKTDCVASGLSAAPSSSVTNSSISETTFDDLESNLSSANGNEESPQASILTSSALSSSNGNQESLKTSIMAVFGAEDIASSECASSFLASHEATTENIIVESLMSSVSGDNLPEELSRTVESDAMLDGLVESEITLENTEQMRLNEVCTEGIMQLRKEAVENGMAVVLDGDSLDDDSVFKKAVAFGKTAPTGPLFRHHRPKKLVVEKGKENDCAGSDLGVKEASVVIGTDIVSSGRDERKSIRRSQKMEDIKGDFLNIVPQGNLRVDELAKLLA